jgi:hypothetical protein
MSHGRVKENKEDTPFSKNGKERGNKMRFSIGRDLLNKKTPSPNIFTGIQTRAQAAQMRRQTRSQTQHPISQFKLSH